MFNVKTITLLVLLTFTSTIFANDFDLVKANEYMRKVDIALAQEEEHYNNFKEMYSELEKLNYQAEQCIQDETKKLAGITSLEENTGLVQDTQGNAEDVKYITNKKKIHTGRLSQCRLYVFKSQDKMYDLQSKINALDESQKLSVGEQIWETLTHKQTLLMSISILMLLVCVSFGLYIFLRNKISKTHFIRITKTPELKLLRYTFLLLICGWVLFLGLEWLDLPSLMLQKTQDFLVNGTSIYNLNIIPLRLIAAVIIFCLLQIIGKYIAMRFANQEKFNDESETNIVIGSFLKYVVFAIAAIISLLVAGFDFTGLAIVAGALSVGIGFGLQNIVNNFVSGLILLIEKPIRPGDRIMVKGIEGYVEEISIRSTRMISFLKEEIIFPNSDMISNPITNYVLHGTLSKMTCRVIVGYQNDIQLITDTLTEIAMKHPEILKDSKNKPSVVLVELKDNGMLFELGCVVKHVDKKYGIASEINIMIVNTFKEKGIAISIPQLEIHMEKQK